MNKRKVLRALRTYNEYGILGFTDGVHLSLNKLVEAFPPEENEYKVLADYSSIGKEAFNYGVQYKGVNFYSYFKSDDEFVKEINELPESVRKYLTK